MRPASSPSILDAASFALVPFSNRIARGRFLANGKEVVLAPNFPGMDHPHPLHGYGWLSNWQVIAQDPASALLEHVYPGGEWPWAYRARQSFRLGDGGLALTLSLTNMGTSPMPAGLGFHPYFPRTQTTIYRGLHRGEWTNDDDCLPLTLSQKPLPFDWWEGSAVRTRAVDTVYTGREGPLMINWPERDMELMIEPSPNLDFTVVYTPKDADFFCVEPVSHMTNAVNHEGLGTGLEWLEPEETFTVGLNMAIR